MKTTISLDPEYIPWEPGAPVVRLRRTKAQRRLTAFLSAGALALLFGAFLGYGYLSQAQPATPEAPATVAAVPTPGATAAAYAPPALVMNSPPPGTLAIVRDNTAVFFRCDAYRVRLGEHVLAEGTTEAGALVTAIAAVTVECDHETFVY